MGISDEKYVSVTTLRTSGEPVVTPTWITSLDGSRVGFWTSSAAGKAKRLRRDPRVTVQPCDARGRIEPGSTPINGTAELVASGPEWDAIQRQIRAKYGLMVRISGFLNTVGHIGRGNHPYGDLGAVITIDAGPVR